MMRAFKAFTRLLLYLSSGLKSALFGISITSAIYYYWYELIKAGFEARIAAGEAISIVENMITGAIAGI
jgi:solute carrier family 25 (peroxisomal adenine nucleotide transporter), member 17